jgi:ABC-2 type transport system ATP-binding protein
MAANSALHSSAPTDRTEGRIVVDNLTKVFGTQRAVDSLSFTVEPGSVTGFLGPNGAGKTTTLRMLLGLIAPTSGAATINGVNYHSLPRPLQTVGAALEAASFHPAHTGLQHLRIYCAAAGLPAQRAEEVLQLVGLADAAKKKTKGYSMGMRQRLGLAGTLLGDPRVLILDEPANGLDPAGIRWIRDLLRTFADEGGTVLLSSHLLHEVQVIADDIVMIGHGRIVWEGSKAELLKGAGTVVRARDTAALDRALRTSGLVTTRSSDGALHTDADPTVVGLVARESGLALTELRTADDGLEEMFFALTADTSRERKAA